MKQVASRIFIKSQNWFIKYKKLLIISAIIHKLLLFHAFINGKHYLALNF